MHGSNPIAEKRRQRKLENQRLEAAAKERQEELRLQSEREIKRQEDERLAAEQRRLGEIQQLKRLREAEQARIAGLERAEKDRILSIERKLKLIAAFCTREIDLPSDVLPRCCGVLSPSALESPIIGVDETLAFVGDDSGYICVYRLSNASCLSKIRIGYDPNCTSDEDRASVVSALYITRSGLLVVCDQERGAIGAYALNQLMTSFYTASTAPDSTRVQEVNGSKALIATFCIAKPSAGAGARTSRIRSVSVDDTANELYVADDLRHCVHVLTLNQSAKTSTRPPISYSRSLGSKGHGKGQLHSPCGADTSHYHVLVCDRGNNRLVAFTKRGGFVCNIGCKGSNPGQFMDPRDVRVTSVRKRALLRGMPSDENSILSEQFELIVADLGNFRVQILNEAGTPVRVLSLLSGEDQIKFHQGIIGSSIAQLLQHYAVIRTTLPTIHGTDLRSLYSLAECVHPSSLLYQNITQHFDTIRTDSRRFHHPRGVSFADKERHILVLDRQNCKLYVYNSEGSRSVWKSIPRSEGARQGGSSCLHSSLVVLDRIYLSDPGSHRIAVLKYPSLEFDKYIGACTYGSAVLCSEGFLANELRSPSYLATYQNQDGRHWILVADTGNHTILVIDHSSGAFIRRIGRGFGHQDGYLDSPRGLAVSQNGWLYVCDYRNHRVQIFDLVSTRFVRSFGKEQGTQPGEFSFPMSVAVCGMLSQVTECNFGDFRSAMVAVGDSGNCRVQVFEATSGSLLHVIDVSQTPYDLPILPTAIAFHSKSNYFFVADENNRCVIVFRNNGTFVAAFGNNLEPENCYGRPSGIQLSASEGTEHVIITDAARMAICSYDLQAN